MAETSAFCLVFGTSASPFHRGHSQLIIESTHALERRGYQVSEVDILPVYRRHNVSDEIKARLEDSFEDRLALCEIGAKEINRALDKPENWVEVSRLEEALALETGEVNYTAESMAVMRGMLAPEVTLGFLIGTDSLSGETPNLLHWYNLEGLLRTTTLVICPREGFEPNLEFIEKLKQQGANLIYLEEVRVADISSSDIREKLVENSDLTVVVKSGWLSQEALDYILDHHLVELWQLQS